ncbi:hypothetical protein [Sorangium sp. So ce233]|uniref:hypothetical protein n=1 Tax=Sorangium sp. So ce233 TaxID=3133290 RepID=UPI003F5F75F6
MRLPSGAADASRDEILLLVVWFGAGVRRAVARPAPGAFRRDHATSSAISTWGASRNAASASLSGISCR